MKKLSSIIIFLVLFITGYNGYHSYRYDIKTPMPDIEYKKSIIKDSHNLIYNLESLRPLMGPDELSEFIKENDKNPQIYTPSPENLASGKFRATLHTHTTKSDGIPTVEDRMNEAQNYAEKHIKDGYVVLAVTDHNTVWGAKEVIKVLETNRNKYDKIKVVAGIEISTKYNNSKTAGIPIDIHVLTWCINPYNEFLKQEFFKKDPNDKLNRKYPDRDFDWVIKTMTNHGIVGVAHPARYTEELNEYKYPYITEMLTHYKKLNPNIKFTEGYYQSYKQTATGNLLGTEYDRYINYINQEAKRLGIIRTGSTDAHGLSMFGYRKN
jgi:hypothetical protein